MNLYMILSKGCGILLSLITGIINSVNFFAKIKFNNKYDGSYIWLAV